MLTQDEYRLAMQSLMDGAAQLHEMGEEAEAFAIFLGLPKVAWDLTRPDTICETRDLMPYIAEAGIDTGDMNEATAYVILGGDGSTLMAFGTGGGQGQPLTDAVGVRVSEIAEQVMIDMGVDPDSPGLKSMSHYTKAKTEKSIDAEVEKFTAEIDDLFKTWGGEA